MRKATHELTNDPVVLKIIHELRVQGKTSKELELAIGLRNGALTRWKYSQTKSYMKYIDVIADFLNMSTNELTNGNVESRKPLKQEITDAEMQVIDLYRKVGYEERRYIQKTLECFASINDLRRKNVAVGD